MTTLKLGDWNAVCEVCDFEFKASELRKRWDGAYVCKEDYEPRHPSDFYRGRTEDTSVPWTRPEAAEAGGTDINGDTFPPTRIDTTTDVPDGDNDGSL